MPIRNMKITIPNRDVDNPDETKEIAPLDLYLEPRAETSEASPELTALINKAASAAPYVVADTHGPADRLAVKKAHGEIEDELKIKAKALAADKLGDDMSATVTVRLFKKRPPSFGNFERDVVQLFLLGDQYLSMSNGKLAEHVNGKYDGFEVRESLFYAPLKPWAKKKVHELLAQHEKRIDLSGKPSLSNIKQALKGGEARKKASRSYTASFSFADDEVVVNGKVYPITVTKKGWRRIRTGNQWISVDNFEALLRNGSPPLLSE